MKKKRLISVSCLLLACLMTMGLWGCTGSSGDEIPTLGSLPTSAPTNTPSNSTTPTTGGNGDSDAVVSATVTHEQIKTAKIVYPEGAYPKTGAVMAAMTSLKDKFSLHYSLSIEISDDRVVANHNVFKEYEYEILIGDTNREESGEVLDDLMLNDYGYGLVGTKIVIKGGSEEALIEAIEAFQKNIVVGKKGATLGSTVFYSNRFDTLVSREYIAQNMTINGTPISEISVVYPASSARFEMELARRMADHLTLISGYDIPFYPDSEEAKGKEILIGKTNRGFTATTTEGAAVESNGDYIAVVGSNAYDFGLAQEALADMIDASALNDGVLTVPAVTKALPSTSISIMAYNVYGFDDYESRCDNIRRLVTKYLPDILAYQEPDTSMTNKIKMSDYYDHFYGKPRHTLPNGGLVSDRSGANSISPILYAKDRYEFILGDTKWVTGTPDTASKLQGSSHYRMYTYAMLRDKITGEEFIVVNWHLDFDEKIQVPSMQYMFKFFQENYTDIPVILLGDFNATASEKVISEITVKQGGFTSMHNMTSNWGTKTPASIDWIFGMGCCVSASYYTVCRETYPDKDAPASSMDATWGDGKMPSDHAAVYAEFKFSSNGEHVHDWSVPASAVQWETKPTVPVRPE